MSFTRFLRLGIEDRVPDGRTLWLFREALGKAGLLFLSSTGVNTTASISARKLSNGTTRSIISSGSPFAEIAASRLSSSKNPSCPIVPTSTNLVVISQIRTNWQRRLFFEAPMGQDGQDGGAEVERLIEAAKGNRHGHRDALMVLLAYGLPKGWTCAGNGYTSKPRP
jgi:IS5 family transposase